MSAPTVNEIMQQQARQPASQAAGVEQSRAVAEVQASLVVAKQRPRDETKALGKALESCRTREVAANAFWKFTRGNDSITGETIHLAVELARCWGNISYGIMELERDDVGGVSEMLAFAWDLETNAQSRMTFLVPHVRDTRSGPKKIVDMRDIYENNANQGARRLRECIFRVLPPYLKEAAKVACYETLEKRKSEKPLTVAIAEAIEAFEKIGISRERLEGKLGRMDKLTYVDLAQLEISYTSIVRKEIAPEEEFPTVEADEAARQIRQATGKSAPDTPSEGRTDEQHGDQHDGNSQAVADDLIERAGRAAIIGDIINLRGEMEKAAGDLSDDAYDAVRDAISEAEKRIRSAA